jgi:hypothetical protein
MAYPFSHLEIRSEGRDSQNIIKASRLEIHRIDFPLATFVTYWDIQGNEDTESNVSCSQFVYGWFV